MRPVVIRKIGRALEVQEFYYYNRNGDRNYFCILFMS